MIAACVIVLGRDRKIVVEVCSFVGQRQGYCCKQQTRTENKKKKISSKDLKGQKSSSIDEVSDSNLRCLRLCLRYGRGPAICLIPRMEMFVAPSEMAIIRLWGS